MGNSFCSQFVNIRPPDSVPLMSGKEKGGMLRRAALFVGAPGDARF